MKTRSPAQALKCESLSNEPSVSSVIIFLIRIGDGKWIGRLFTPKKRSLLPSTSFQHSDKVALQHFPELLLFVFFCVEKSLHTVEKYYIILNLNLRKSLDGGFARLITHDEIDTHLPTKEPPEVRPFLSLQSSSPIGVDRITETSL